MDVFVFRRVQGQELADLEDAAEVAGVPEDVAPDGGLEALVERERSFGADDFGDAVEEAGVFCCLRGVYNTDTIISCVSGV